MGENCCDESCCEGKSDSCCCNECCGEGMDMGKMMMQLANEAWSELMKEKMKAAYQKSIGNKMDKIAAVGVEACIGYWNSKAKEKASCAEFEEKLRKVMM